MAGTSFERSMEGKKPRQTVTFERFYTDSELHTIYRAEGPHC